MTKKYFGTDGIRGAINSKNINGDMFFKFGLASGTYFKSQKKKKQSFDGIGERNEKYQLFSDKEDILSVLSQRSFYKGTYASTRQNFFVVQVLTHKEPNKIAFLPSSKLRMPQ